MKAKSPRRASTRRQSVPARREPRDLLARILETPELARAVPRLQPEVLHRVIERCGLEDCADLVALATGDQLTRVFDLDLWRAAGAAREERFDPDRFGVWLEVLLESGDSFAAQKLAAIDPTLVITALAQHMLVFDTATLPSASDDGEVIGGHTVDERHACEIGGYTVVPLRLSAWDAIVAVLIALDTEKPRVFHRIMSGCRRLSNSTPERDGLDELLLDRDQAMFELASGREQRREQHGYVTAADARAFLQMARGVRLGPDSRPPDARAAMAAFRPNSLEATPTSEALPDQPAASVDADVDVRDVLDVLTDAGVLPQRPRALLEAPSDGSARLVRIHAHLQTVAERNAEAWLTASQELAYLANVLLEGCPLQDRAFTPQEASDAALAVCNLGLEQWPAHWDDPASGHGPDLLRVFQAGWAVLYRDVCLFAARHIANLALVRCQDAGVQSGLDDLAAAMTRHLRDGAPWRAREALDVIAILDMPAWAALLALTAECPVMHAAIDAARDPHSTKIDPAAFAFISENDQIEGIQAFVRALPDLLR